MFTNRPAAKFFLPFCIGIIIGWHVQIPVLFIVVSGVLFGIVILKRDGSQSLHSFLIFVLLLLCGITKITIDSRFLPGNDISHFHFPLNKVQLKGTVNDLPRTGGSSIKLVLDAETLCIGHTNIEVSGGVLVSVDRNNKSAKKVASLSYGRKILLNGELLPVSVARNPGEFDLKQYLHVNNIDARFHVSKGDTIAMMGEEVNGLMAMFVYPVRSAVAERIDHFIGGEEAKFLKGLIIGERSEIPLEVKNAFINSGVMHIIAVSGLHVVIVTFIILIVLETLRIPEKGRILITCLLLFYYSFLTGGAASVVRSVIMAVIFLIGKLIERKTDIYNTLALSAIVILLFDSKQLFQPGFQLSYVAVFALVYLFPKINEYKNYFPERFRKNTIVSNVLDAFAVSIAAGIGTLPFTSLYFGRISLIGFFANIVIVPLSNIVLALGMVTAGFSWISSYLTSFYAESTKALTWLLLKLVDVLGNLPYSSINSQFTLVSSLAFYTVVGICANYRNVQIRNLLIIGLLCISNYSLYSNIVQGADEQHTLQVTFLDVGQGDGIVVECPDGKTLLIDAGPRSFRYDAGARVIAPYLKRKNIRRIDAVVVSHPHSDHLGGVPFILRNFIVDRVIDAGSYDRSQLSLDYVHLVDSMHLERANVAAGSRIDGFEDVRLYILHPSGIFIQHDSNRTVNLNNQSVIIKLMFGKTTLLLPGDGEREAEMYLEHHYGTFLKSDVMKAGHHGSITSSSPVFLKAVQPEYAVISVAVRNKFGHPSPVIIERFRHIVQELYRTDQSGAIILQSDGECWRVVDWR